MKATVNGISTYYEIHGSEGAPWLTFSHSLACSVRMWDGQIAAFKDRYRILVYDTRGHSGSAAPAGAYTLELLAEDLLELLKKLETAAGVAQNLPFEVNVWRTQNNYYEMLQKVLPEQVKKAGHGDTTARQWVEHFVGLGRNLAMKVDQPAMPELQKAA